MLCGFPPPRRDTDLAISAASTAYSVLSCVENEIERQGIYSKSCGWSHECPSIERCSNGVSNSKGKSCEFGTEVCCQGARCESRNSAWARSLGRGSLAIILSEALAKLLGDDDAFAVNYYF